MEYIKLPLSSNLTSDKEKSSPTLFGFRAAVKDVSGDVKCVWRHEAQIKIQKTKEGVEGCC